MRLALKSVIILFLAITSCGYSVEIINKGVAGNNTNDILSRLNNDVISLNPDLTILLAGTNDMLNSQNSVSFEDYELNLRNIADQILNSGSDLIIMTVLPCIEDLLLTRHPESFYEPYGPNGKIEIANQIIESVATEKGIETVDIYPLFVDNISLSADSLLRNPVNSGASDGIHPTAEGYSIIANKIFSDITDLGLNPQKIVCVGDSITYGVYMLGAGTATGETYPGRLASLLNSDTVPNGPDGFVIPCNSIIASASSWYNGRVPQDTVCSTSITNDLCNTDIETTWSTPQLPGEPTLTSPSGALGPAWIKYDLGGLYRISEMWVWNCNFPNATDRGLRYVDISFSEDNTNWTKLGDFTLTIAPGTENYEHQDEINFHNNIARYIVITPHITPLVDGVRDHDHPLSGNYGFGKPNTPSYDAIYSLSEVRVYYEPFFMDDGTVDYYDFCSLAEYWNSYAPEYDIAPLGGDGIINELDLLELANYWLQYE